MSLLIAPLMALYVIHDLSFLTAERLMRSLVCTGILLAVFGLLEEAGRYLDWLRLASAVDGGFEMSHLMPPAIPRSGGLMHVNEQALLLDAIIPIALLLGLRPRGRFDRVLGLGGGALMLAGTFVTFTRGGWLGLAAALCCFAVLYFFSGRSALLDRLRRVPPAKAAMAGTLASVVLAGAAIAAWDARPSFLFRDTLSYRQESSARALEMIGERPIFGSGANSFGLLYESNGGEYPRFNVHPHNAYLSVLVDSGVVGAVLILGAAAVVAAWFTRAFLRSGRGGRLTLAACLAAVVTVLVHGLVLSVQLFQPLLLILALVAVIAVRAAPPQVPVLALRRAGVPARFAIAGLVPLVLAGWAYFDRPHSRYDDSLALYGAGRLEEAAALAGAAASIAPSSAAYQIHAGAMEAELYSANGSPAHLERAARHFQRAIDLDPYGGFGYANLALVLLEQGAYDAAAEEAAQALDRAPLSVEIAAIAGTVFERAGMPDRAVDAYARAVQSEPLLSQSPFWRSTPERVAMRSEVIAATGAHACELGEAAAVVGAYIEELPRLLEDCRQQGPPTKLGSTAGDALAIMLYGSGQHEALQRETERLQAGAPGGSTTAMAQGLLAAAEGRLEEARRQFLAAGYVGDANARVFLAATYGSASGWNDVSPVLRLPASADPAPQAIQDLAVSLRRSNPSFASRGSLHTAQVYFQIDLMRAVPPIMLVPGEWRKLISLQELPSEDRLAVR